MGLLDRFRRRPSRLPRPGGRGPTTVRPSDSADEKHLTEFATSRRGVEGFVEPRTAVSDVTIILVAHDGEWTRRRVPSVEWAHAFANKRGIPSYDAAVVGYPHDIKGQGIYCFVTLIAGTQGDEQLKKELMQLVRDDIGGVVAVVEHRLEDRDLLARLQHLRFPRDAAHLEHVVRQPARQQPRAGTVDGQSRRRADPGCA